MTEKEIEDVYLAYLVLGSFTPLNEFDDKVLKSLKVIINKYTSRVYFT